MSAVNAPFGFEAAYHPSGQIRSKPYPIASAFAASIFKGDPVKLVTGGVIELGTSDGTRLGTVDNVGLIGIFAGVEYIDANGKPTVSNYWPGGTTATNIRAYVWDDPDTIFRVQGSGAIAQTAVGDQMDWGGFAAPGGSTATGISTGNLNIATIVGAGQQGQFSIREIAREVDNAAGDAFTVVLASIAEHQLRAEAVAV